MHNSTIPKPPKIEKLTSPESETGVITQTLEQPEEYTRIDFISFANPKYINGGWCNIDKDTFIRPSGTNERYFLLKAVNIPYKPMRHHYRHTMDFHSYTLYFPALPKWVESIDIIERVGEPEYVHPEIFVEEQHLRLYNICVDRIKSAPIKLYNFPHKPEPN